MNRRIDEQYLRTSRSRSRIKPNNTSFRTAGDLEADREFETELRALENLEKELEELEKSIVPYLPSIFLHEAPELALGVASPDVKRNLLFGKGAGLLITPLLAWPVMVVMGRRRTRIDASPKSSRESQRKSSSEDEW